MYAHLRLAIIALCLSAPVAAGEIPEHIAAAIAHPDRSAANRERDGDRKPGEVFTFFAVQPGMTIADIGSGGGYFTEILAAAVGPSGKVYAHNLASPQFEQRRAALADQYAPFGNIQLDAVAAGTPLPYADGSVDMVLLSLLIHHFHYSEESGESIPAASAESYADFLRVLKPGGVFAIIEHRAIDGSSRADSASWHRIPEAVLQADVSSAGFEFDGEDETIHFNPADPMNIAWFGIRENEDGSTERFDNGLRGKTTRLVYRYRKPLGD